MDPWDRLFDMGLSISKKGGHIPESEVSGSYPTKTFSPTSKLITSFFLFQLCLDISLGYQHGDC